jgi:hypothetical protein
MAFRELVESYGRWKELPEGAFKDSGTMVRNMIVAGSLHVRKNGRRRCARRTSENGRPKAS